ncbi:unnamed protein product [Toxocara canis]|uniref:Protein kinase domain-containing protein n=1 Tax=Toxocara canis TaxID=6265 RepID=A0A183UK04_TOXCA|nr:unnamed protein product [Toxocara canis]
MDDLSTNSERKGFNLGAVLRKRGFVLSENAFLGKGRFGKVYKALHIESDKEMAIKIIDKQKLSFTTRFKFLPREIRGWQKLHHRHIVELFHYFEEDQKVFFATQLAEKGDLLSYIQKNGPQTEHLAQSWMWQLVSAVQYMHLQWIAHRDLKLDNILLFSDNNVKISDFGLCRDEILGFPVTKVAELKKISYSSFCKCTYSAASLHGCDTTFLKKSEHELSMTYCGSKAFMAPEVLLALPHPPFKADVWSLGIIAFALLTNRYPFDHRATIIRMIKAQRSRAYRFPERIKISAACRYTIDALLTYDFAMRPTIHQVNSMSRHLHFGYCYGSERTTGRVDGEGGVCCYPVLLINIIVA